MGNLAWGGLTATLQAEKEKVKSLRVTEARSSPSFEVGSQMTPLVTVTGASSFISESLSFAICKNRDNIIICPAELLGLNEILHEKHMARGRCQINDTS